MTKFGKNPVYSYLWKFLLRARAKNDIEFLCPACPALTSLEQMQADMKRFRDELADFSDLRRAIREYQQFLHVEYDQVLLGSQSWFPLLYYLIRIKKPEIVIETGCATGLTTTLILYGLQNNQAGQHYSIDVRFPSDWLSTNQLPSGFLVPENLKSRWTLILDDARVALPELLARLGRVDFFYHDSDHQYLHQMWEYLTAWHYLPRGGVMASDDLSDSTAFFDFSRQMTGCARIENRQRSFGAMIKA